MTPNGRKKQRLGGAVLTEREVAEIKRKLLKGFSARELAESYEVGSETIRRIARGDSWNWVKPLGLDGELVPELTEVELAKAAAVGLAELLASGLVGESTPTPQATQHHFAKLAVAGEVEAVPLLVSTALIAAEPSPGQEALDRLLDETNRLREKQAGVTGLLEEIKKQ